MSLFKRFSNFFKRNEKEVEETLTSVPKESKPTPIGSELVYDSNLRWELKKIAKAENKTMGEIVSNLVEDYINNYPNKTSLDTFKETPKVIEKTMIAKCAFCGKEFNKTHNSAKYCSDECRVNARKAQMHEYNKQYYNKKRKQKTPSPKKGKKIKMEILPNGLNLRAISCVLYSPVPWWGGNGAIYYGNGQLFPFSLSQLLDLKKHFNEIPKDDKEERLRWIEDRYDIKLRSIDRILWNLYKGTFDHIFEAYYQKNYRIQFDKQGQVILGE